MKFIRALLQLHNISHCLTHNTQRIKNLEEDAIERDRKQLRDSLDLDDLTKEVREIDRSLKTLEDYTRILSGRIAKLKGNRDEKKNNSTG